jgi:glycosyltransferase involved in cell wall biosynthesis
MRTIGEPIAPRGRQSYYKLNGAERLIMTVNTTPIATVAICTHNRAADVKRCLAALSPQAARYHLPIIVVDSGSDTANSAALLLLSSQANVQHIRCDAPGLSVARNAAAAAASSEWIVFIDDDAIPHPDWAENLLRTITSIPETVSIIGGRIDPMWPPAKGAAHITPRWKLLLSCTNERGSGDVPTQFNICGANLAVRLNALRALGMFPINLGRIGNRLISGEEAYLIEQVRMSGQVAWYDDSFAVDHVISAERMTFGWAKRRAFWEGVTRIRILHHLGQPVPRSMGVLKLAVSAPVLIVLGVFSFDYCIRYNMAIGSLWARLRPA